MQVLYHRTAVPEDFGNFNNAQCLVVFKYFYLCICIMCKFMCTTCVLVLSGVRVKGNFEPPDVGAVN